MAIDELLPDTIDYESENVIEVTSEPEGSMDMLVLEAGALPDGECPDECGFGDVVNLVESNSDSDNENWLTPPSSY